MPNLFINGIPEAWAESLRLRAARNHRSLQGERVVIVELGVASGAVALVSAGDSIADPARDGAEPAPEPGIPLGVDIIREPRDSR